MKPADSALLHDWIIERDAEAFAEIVKRYAGLVYGAANRILGNSAEAEDISQECFLVLADAQLPGPKSLPAWLHVVATRRALNKVRNDRARERREVSQAEPALSQRDPEWEDIKSCVDDAINELPVELKDVVISHFLLQRTHRSIAKDLGVTRQTVTRRIAKGVGEIRGILEQKGISAPIALLGSLLTAHAYGAAPQQLVASLGKLAVAGTTGTGATLPTATALIPASVSKWAVIAAIALLLAWAGYMNWTGIEPPNPLQVAELEDTPVDLSQLRASNLPTPAQTALETVRPESAKKETVREEQATETPASLREVTGIVYDINTGEPLVDAKVTAESRTTRKTKSGLKIISLHEQHTFTNSSGEFHIENLLKNRYTLNVTLGKRDLVAVWPRVDLRSKEEERGIEIGVSIPPNTFAVIEGRVTLGNIGPVEGVQIRVQYDAFWDENTKSIVKPRVENMVTGRNGEYRVRDLDVGTVALSVGPNFSKTGTGQMTQFVDLKAGEKSVVNFDFPASSGAMLEGRVKQTPHVETILPGELITIESSTGGTVSLIVDSEVLGSKSAVVRAYTNNRFGVSMMWSQSVPPGGQYTFIGLPAGLYEVVVEPVARGLRTVGDDSRTLRMTDVLKASGIIRIGTGIWTKTSLPEPPSGDDPSAFIRTYYSRYEDALAAWGTDAQFERPYDVKYVNIQSNVVTELDFDFTASTDVVP